MGVADLAFNAAQAGPSRFQLGDVSDAAADFTVGASMDINPGSPAPSSESPDPSANTYTATAQDIERTRPTTADDNTGSYKLNDIITVYHPNSGKPREHQSFEDFRRSTTQDTEDAFKLYEKNLPWTPFRSRADFEFSEIALHARLSQADINSLISFIRRCADGEESFTLKNAKDVKDTWEAASKQHTPFVRTTISVPYKRTVREHPVHYRSLWDWTLEQLHNPFLAPHFVWDAQRLYRFNGEMFKHFLDEPWTASNWWDIQSTLPPDGRCLCYIIYADKTKLSSFGTAKEYPVIARIANLPVYIRNGEGVGGGCVVGWLPIVPDDPDEKSKTGFANYKRVVWHEAFLLMLKTLADVSKLGSSYQTAELLIRLFPLILVLSADYEEQCFMTLIRGFNGLRPCPVCLVPATELSNLSATYPFRTADEVQELLASAAEEGTEEREAMLKDQGLRNIQNAFWIVNNSDPFKAVSFDRLHAYHEGLFGKHLWVLLQKFINGLGRQSAQAVDDYVKAMPSWRGLSHFFSSNIILFGTHGIFDQTKHSLAYKLLKVIRAYINLDILFAMEVHTEDTLATGDQALLIYDQYLRDYKNASKGDEEYDKDWKFPKAHTHKHGFQDMRGKGPTRGFNSKINEKLHGPLKEAFDVSNKQHDSFVDQASALSS
ncbi:hypothetical protein K474DRAFT_1677885 [Panus rudis PR-1116 ss-1]|nr:hypothetical protein K474DRAFT_1677885 [Panus rudis PR-1116 ss-1]